MINIKLPLLQRVTGNELKVLAAITAHFPASRPSLLDISELSGLHFDDVHNARLNLRRKNLLTWKQIGSCENEVEYKANRDMISYFANIKEFPSVNFYPLVTAEEMRLRPLNELKYQAFLASIREYFPLGIKKGLRMPDRNEFYALGTRKAVRGMHNLSSNFLHQAVEMLEDIPAYDVNRFSSVYRALVSNVKILLNEKK